jgi:intracellular sulfur oxidation DsrE/DsrF family protein
VTRDDYTQEAWLNAYLDDELAPSDRYEFLQQLLQDDELCMRVCELHRTKELVRHAFAEPPAPPVRQKRRKPHPPWRRIAAAAAVFALMVLSFAGGLYANNAGQPSLRATLSSLGAVGLEKAGFSNDPNRVLLHIASENDVKFAHTLDQAAHLLKTYHKQGLVVEVVVNGGALGLLQAGDNPYATRVHALMKKYPNLHIVACGTGIGYLEARGFPIDLMRQVRVAPSAVEEIVKRLREGWVYVNA